MGCDIHAFVEIKSGDRWRHEPLLQPFPDRNYGLFGFLANVRNYSCVPSISDPRGLPDGISTWVQYEVDRWGIDGHSHSWVTLKELVEFDYSRKFIDARVVREIAPGFISGRALADLDAGEGQETTFHEFLGPYYFRCLNLMKALNERYENVRIVFWFDN